MNILTSPQCKMKCGATLRKSGEYFTTMTQFYVSSGSIGCITWFSAEWTAIAVSHQVQMTVTIHFSETCLSETDNTKIALFIWTAECEVFNMAYLNLRPINQLFSMLILIVQTPLSSVLIHMWPLAKTILILPKQVKYEQSYLSNVTSAHPFQLSVSL